MSDLSIEVGNTSMSILILGMLMAMSLMQMFRLNSWVIGSAIMMLLTSVALSVTTEFNVINPVVSILTLLAAVTLLLQSNLRFGDLLALNFLLLLHVMAAYLSEASVVISLALFMGLYWVSAWIKNQPWVNWLIAFSLALWWLILGISYYWLFTAVIFISKLLRSLCKEKPLNVS